MLNDGGGIRSNASNLPATLNVYNSTISGNRGFYRGGGILVYTAGPSATAHSTATLINTTVTNNRSNVSGVSYGGMLMVWDNDGGAAIARITLQNSLIADPSVTVNCVTHLGGQIVSNNNNLDSGNTCALAQPNDIANGTANLGVLQDNGGPTFTQALLSGSQAIDAGNNAACAAASINNVDQRGWRGRKIVPATSARMNMSRFPRCEWRQWPRWRRRHQRHIPPAPLAPGRHRDIQQHPLHHPCQPQHRCCLLARSEWL